MLVGVRDGSRGLDESRGRDESRGHDESRGREGSRDRSRVVRDAVYSVSRKELLGRNVSLFPF